MILPPSSRRCPERGFTLVELLVTLVVVSIGLLGVAKLEAAATAESGVARTRSLMSLQAEALAAAMRSNEAFWQSSTAYTQSINITGGAIASQTPTTMTQVGTNGGSCTGILTCTAVQQAYDDVSAWASTFGAQFPTATGTIVCNGSATTPETCDITLSWNENSVAINRSTAAAATAASGIVQNTSYMVLHVQP